MWDVKPTATGKVTVTVTVSRSGHQTKYEFEVVEADPDVKSDPKPGADKTTGLLPPPQVVIVPKDFFIPFTVKKSEIVRISYSVPSSIPGNGFNLKVDGPVKSDYPSVAPIRNGKYLDVNRPGSSGTGELDLRPTATGKVTVTLTTTTRNNPPIKWKYEFEVVEPEGKPAPALPVRVSVPLDTTPFTLLQGHIVRLTGKYTPSIPGSKIEATVDGPAKIDATETVLELKDGKRPAPGSPVTKEFDVKPTATGKVTATITVTPALNQPPTITKYEFEVK